MNEGMYEELAAAAQVALDKREFVSWAFENASTLIDLLRHADRWKQDSVELNSILFATAESDGFKADETGVISVDSGELTQLAIRKINSSLGSLSRQIVTINEANGWNTPEVDTPVHQVAVIALIAGEAHEAIEELRDGHGVDEIYHSSHVLGVVEEDGLGEFVNEQVVQKPEGVPIELADVIIRTLDFCAKRDIDIAAAIKMKLEYNKTRAFRHGDKVL